MPQPRGRARAPAAAGAAVTKIVRARGERIDDLRPLWDSMRAHHAEVAPHLEELGPRRAADESWALRRALYEQWLAESDAFVLIAEIEERPVGYALVRMRGPEETWTTGDRVADIESLALLPDHRGEGIGSALLARMHEELRAEGVEHWGLGVIATNADAVRFYERQGLLPFVKVYLGRVPAATEAGPKPE